ncbi:MAG TPA: DUF58 domain-containing protein [Chitinophagaceae bacterium]|nr:DUF58 domain-containing protein [Chitinophagaceae bacterium]
MFFRAIIKFFGQSFYLDKVAYYIAGASVILYVFSYFIPVLYDAAGIILVLLGVSILIDSFLIFGKRYALRAERITSERWSNGDDNKIVLHFQNNYSFPISAHIIDELPVQLQERNWFRKARLERNSEAQIVYTVKPLTRGEYSYGNINVFVKGPLQLAKRRFVFPAAQTVKVYPSYIQMRRYHLLAVSNRLQEAGVKRVRRLGHSMEFEQIKEYVRGDDYRTINWKATARKGGLMVNNYTDERSQQIYCLINKGRTMKMPFEGMTLLDYAVNATLVLSNVALVRQDKAGLITFAENLDAFLQADKKSTQMNLVLETLYRQQTRFLEADFEKLYSVIRNRITHRSLLVLFTNFESMDSLQREMSSLKRIAQYHLLLVVFFENTELKELIESKAVAMEDIYIKTIAEKFAFEKRLMVKELHKNGILSVLTSPQNLTVDTINKYLELKNKLSI